MDVEENLIIITGTHHKIPQGPLTRREVVNILALEQVHRVGCRAGRGREREGPTTGVLTGSKVRVLFRK